MTSSFKKYILTVATLSGTIIGVGLFSLPYITVKVGLWVMLGYLVVLTALVLLIHLFFAEVALKTPDFLRLPGYSQFHLGKAGRIAATIIIILGSFGTILAYIIIGGDFLSNLLVPIFGGSNFIYTFIYFLTGALFIFWGTKAISKIEFWGMLLFFISLLIVFQNGLGFIRLENLPFQVKSSGNLFLPYGPILFALWGATLIPEIEEMLGRDKKMIKKVVIASAIIPALCYFLFILLITSISGSSTSYEAISGLKNVLGNGIVNIMFIAGILATFTSFIAIGLNLKKVLWYDIKIPKNISWALTCFIPLILYVVGFKDFIGVIGFIGAVALAAEGILILLMYRKVEKRKIRFLAYPLISIFIMGIIYEIIYFFKFL
ncbi:hypothetical protein KJ786_02660 [Patescibacteria group bacterium]|nr:hypothetical protein [Patescibacteria group bacterium]